MIFILKLFRMFDDLNHLNFHIKLNLGLPGSSLRNINPNKHFRKSKTKKKISNVNELNSKQKYSNSNKL
ncbi:hypothetical protein DERP_007745 [Dermatophagoides pteronyssinus]|uniref:Uncharacterized protein n=1 Tax=Dermatophagoides pteronyssinus TaxID=6956 RepID=A0ABQ8JKL8_DERPT|nr:hypothetical protein DERP_007745 [Dermatophagoides pteronyssinus]